MYGSPNPAPTTLTELEDACQKVCDKIGHTLDQQTELYNQTIHGQPVQQYPKGRSRKLHRHGKGPS